MLHIGTDIPDRTAELSFLEPNQACCDKLLETGIVVVKDVVNERNIRGADRAVRNRFFMSLHRRLLAKSLAKIPNLDTWEWRMQLHARTSQVDPNNLPVYMRSAAPAVADLIQLNKRFFDDPRIQEMYGRNPGFNNANIARYKAGADVFTSHQDSIGLTGLGPTLQSRYTRWSITAWAGSRATEDYTFGAERGDVVVQLQRAGACPAFIPSAVGHNPEYWQADGTEIHSGVNMSDQVRYRIALAYQELAEGV